MAGVKTGTTASVLYKLPADGSCAQESCAVWASDELPASTGR